MVAILTAMKSGRTRFDGRTCTRLQLTTHEEGAAVTEGRPTLAGTLGMDCRVTGDRVTADVEFKQCEW